MTEINKIEVGKRIQNIMQSNKITQKEMAGLLGISQPAISLYLQGRIPPPEVLLQISRLGNTTMEWLLIGKKPSQVGQSKVINEPAPLYGNQSTLLFLWKQLPGQIQRDLLKLMQHFIEG